MENQVKVSIKNGKEYSIYLKESFLDLKKLLPNKRLFIITESTVAELYLETLYEALDMKIDTYIFKAGEENKNIETVLGAYSMLLENGHDRDSLILALGGGVCGDIAGFVASTYMRGIDFVQIPTTLLSQVDSSVGGKTGFDFNQAKNIIGAFWQPIFVYVNIKTLFTLKEKDFRSGLVEAIKHGIILDKEHFSYIYNNIDDILLRNPKILKELVKQSVTIKRNIVSKDEKEQGKRALLNYGHTIGHGVEAASSFRLTHGEAVAIGIVAAITLSNMSLEDKELITSLLKRLDLPDKAYGISFDDIIMYLKKDKKFRNGKLSFIKADKIGNARIDNAITMDEIKKGIDSIIEN